MTAKAGTLLVTGIHREELPFGDRVAALLNPEIIDVMRIPEGISNRHVGTDQAFYFNTQHREIYLQLRQQAKGRYRLLIDLHCGANDAGHCADIFCHDPRFLNCLAQQPVLMRQEAPVRLIKIVAPGQSTGVGGESTQVVADAQTWIPREVWEDTDCTYVGLEIYLPESTEGIEDDWRFAQRLIDTITRCSQANGSE